MTTQTWNTVDDYIGEILGLNDPALESALRRNREAQLPAIDVSAAQGRLLQLLVRMSGARNVLEIGTLGGYSTICLARGLPQDGKVTTLELDSHHAKIARANLNAAGFGANVDIIVGPALDSLERLSDHTDGPFDFVFIDADKPNNPAYLTHAMRLSRPGTVIVCDNVIRNGAVMDGSGGDANVEGARAAFSFIGSDARLTGTAIQTVGSKGYDGFAIAIVD